MRTVRSGICRIGLFDSVFRSASQVGSLPRLCCPARAFAVPCNARHLIAVSRASMASGTSGKG